MSAISWREQRARRSAPSEQAQAPNLRIVPWVGIACAATLAVYPNVLAWPAAILGFGAVALLIRQRVAFASPAVNGGLTLFALSLLIGVAAAGPTDPSLTRLTGYLAAIVLALALLALMTNSRAVRSVAVGLVAVVGLGELVVLALLRGSLPSSPFTRLLQPFTGLFSGFAGVSGDTLEVNARFAVHQYGLAHLALVAAPFGIALALSRAPARWRLAGVVWALAHIVLLLATQSRGAVLALALVGAAIGATRTRWAWAAIPGSAALLGLLIARGTLSRQVETDWLDFRLSIWGRTMHMLGDFPLTGVGLGARTYAEAFAWYFSMPDRYAVSHTHNVVLQAYAEQGILGVLGLVAVLVGGCALSVRVIARADAPSWIAGAGAGGAFIGSALYGLTDQVVTSTLSFTLMLALLTVASACAPIVSPGAIALPGQRVARLGAIAGVALMAVLLGLSLGGRWMSGLALNAGSLDLLHALAWPAPAGEERQALLRSAEGWLSRATDLNPKNIAAWRNLGWARTARNDVNGAHQALDQAAAAEGLGTFDRFILGRLYRQLGFTEQAIQQWRAAGDLERLRTAAEELTARGRWREAVAAHAAMLTLEPDNPDHMSNLALAVLNSGGDIEEALRWFSTATELNPEAARSLARQLVLRGEPYRINEGRGGGDANKAIFWFSLASRVDPTYDRPEVEIGAVYMNRQRYAEAETHFRAALARDDSDASLWSWVGESLEGQGRLAEAVEFYRQAVARRPDRAVLQEKLQAAEARLAAGG
jgi:putative inorganic carbon (HCO3(-)) transporter